MLVKKWVSNPKTFNYIGNDIPDLLTETINGKRHYVTKEGYKYPSVTTVLDAFKDKSGLIEWRKRVGDAEANKISGRATRRGTAMHNMCEKYVLNESFDLSSEMPMNVYMFNQMKTALDARVNNVHCVESALVSHKLKVAGRVDLIAEWDGKLAVIDYKTSGKKKPKEWINDYFEQASLYAYMYWEMTGIMIKKIVIMIAVEEETEPQIFIESPGNYIQGVSDNIKKYHDYFKNNA